MKKNNYIKIGIFPLRYKICIYVLYITNKILSAFKLKGQSFTYYLYDFLSFCYSPLRKPGFYITRYTEYPIAISSMTPSIDEIVLDLGSGNSPLPLYFGFKDRFTISIEKDFNNIFHLKELSQFPREKKNSLFLIQGDICNIPLKNNSIDKILCISTIEHLEDNLDKQLIFEIRRLLKKDGKAFISFEMDNKNSVEWTNTDDYSIQKKQYCKRYTPQSILQLINENELELTDEGLFTSFLSYRRFCDKYKNGISYKLLNWILNPLSAIFQMINKQSIKTAKVTPKGSFGYIILRRL